MSTGGKVAERPPGENEPSDNEPSGTPHRHLLRPLPSPSRVAARGSGRSGEVIEAGALTVTDTVPANIAEGEGRVGRDRVYHWRVAYGSARELAVHLTLLGEAGAVDRHAAERVLSLLDEVRAMLWRTTHPR